MWVTAINKFNEKKTQGVKILIKSQRLSVPRPCEQSFKVKGSESKAFPAQRLKFEQKITVCSCWILTESKGTNKADRVGEIKFAVKYLSKLII